MANTVNILSYTNTFGDLLAQQNKIAVEINNIGANNYTKNTGTLYLAGSGTGLSVSNTAVMNVVTIAGTTTVLGDVNFNSANLYLNGTGFGLNVLNNALVQKNLVTDNFTANTLIRTTTINATGVTYVNSLVANTGIRTSGPMVTAGYPTYTDSVQANTIVSAPIINGTSSGIFNVLTSNSSITTVNGYGSGSISAQYINGVTRGYFTDLTANNTITTPNLIVTNNVTGQAVLTGNSTYVTLNVNTSNTAIATTQWVKNVLNSGNTFNMYAGPYSNTMNQNVNTANTVQFNSLGVGTAGSGTTGEIRATNNITAYYSDDRLKTRLGNIENALAKVMSLNGFQYEANETAQALGYTVKPEVGLSAQEVQAVLPEVVVPAPIDEQYLTIHYERVIPLLVEAIKELKKEFDSIRKPLPDELKE
jgi:hypothetical protein